MWLLSGAQVILPRCLDDLAPPNPLPRIDPGGVPFELDQLHA